MGITEVRLRDIRLSDLQTVVALILEDYMDCNGLSVHLLPNGQRLSYILERQDGSLKGPGTLQGDTLATYIKRGSHV